KLENSLISLREDFEKVEGLENNLLELKNKIDGIDIDLRGDIEILSDKLKDFKVNLENKIDSDSESLFEDLASLNKDFESIKDNLLSSMSKAETIESKIDSVFKDLTNENKDFKDRLEKRIAHFEDIWSDNNRIKSLFNSDIREEVENLRKEADIKFEHYISDLKEKMDDIERGI
ncbi:hypothetical protein, partial [Brachyspira aalborgi]|uniref:hypothetical protein n=1 Tax=Brachyspira aalborgi TaxID=29522 RepID=UPI0013159235